jgi:hypothetical protein
MYNVLPYMEEQALHDLGKGLAEGSTPKKTFAAQVVQTPLAWATCPSRRSVDTFPCQFAGNPGVNIQSFSTNPRVARADYSANASDVVTTSTLAALARTRTAIKEVAFGRTRAVPAEARHCAASATSAAP